ncbi:non-ribosomal peptide synthetase [Nostoc sp. 'Peltigera membranacea cyanobiont' 210A]|nr:non-ribosomal peptide synthetase [Nostoc sp. 'Peltigera membranacea cyanobiont' 210A]
MEMNTQNNIESIYPLSPMQQGMLFHTLYAPDSGMYCTQWRCTINGKLNVSAFEQAWARVVDHHPVLRTLFIWEDSKKPLQVVRERVNLPWANLDWRERPTTCHQTSLSLVEPEESLETFLQADLEKGFELNQAPLMRCTLIQMADEIYEFIWTQHHLLIDGWSLPIILQEVFAFYDALNCGDDLHLKTPRSYRDYITWLQQQDLSKAERFWQQALEGFTAPTPFVVDKSFDSNSNQKQTYNQQQIKLSAEITAALQSFVKQHHLTLNILVQGAWALLLSRYSGEGDVVFGATVSGRPPVLLGVESMVGLFINTLPVRVQISEETELLSWLQQLQIQQVDREQYSYSPLVEIHRMSDLSWGMPLFESIVVFENYPTGASLWQQNSNLEIANIKTITRTNYPLAVVAVPDSQLSVQISYDSCRFDAATITRMLGHFQTILAGIAINPRQRLSELPLLTEPERHQLLVEWNDRQTVEYPHKLIPQLFEAQVEKNPDAVAVVFEDQQLTYRELNCRANKIAHHLQTLGVGTEVLVGIFLERSLLVAAVILGILKAGGAFVALDPTYPQERLAYMLNESQASVLLTQKQFVDRLPPSGAKVVYLDSISEANAQENEENLVSKTTSDRLAYVIFTSGSTGKPKGILMTHEGVISRVDRTQKVHNFTSNDRILQLGNISFDMFVWELFIPLLTGARIVIGHPQKTSDFDYLICLINREQVTIARFVPPMLQMLLEQKEFTTCKSIRRVITGGDKLTVNLMAAFMNNFSADLYNQYGPTERPSSITWRCQKSNKTSIPIGRPLPNTEVYILDKMGNLAPIGVVGELYIGGSGLALGYLNDPILTAQKFIQNPFNDQPSSRIYKTGDLVRYLPDGNLEFVGRIDNQVKIRGFRIELEEIEAVLSQHPELLEVVVILREDQPGNPRLVAYFVPQKGQVPTLDTLRNYLKEKLPDYMVPSAFVNLETIPLTPNGKVDRHTLPVPDASSLSQSISFVPPDNATQEILAAIWSEVLKLERVSIYDNFFELGGHSLLATQVFSRLRQAFSIELPLRSLFELPTIAELAKRIDSIHSIMKQLQANPLEMSNNREEVEL